MKRKIFIVLLIGLLLMTILTSCNETTKSLVDCGEDVISLMTEMVDSENYRLLYNLPAAYDKTISNLRNGNYSKSSAVYELSISEDDLFELINTNIDKESFSEDLYKNVCSSAYISFASLINQKGGVEAMSISTAFSAQKSFVNKEMDANKVYLYVFENGCPILITFVAGEDGSFRAVGYFIINDTFVTDDEYSIIESYKASGINNVTVKKQ